MQPADSITAHFRLTQTQIAALRRLGLHTIEDLLYHFPARYERAGASVRVSGLVPGQKVTLFGTISKLKAKKLWKSRRNATEGYFEDGSGRVKVMWFNQPYIASYVPEGSTVQVTGTVGGSAGKPYLANPEVERVPPGTVAEGLFESPESSKLEARSSIFPVYPESKGITSRWFYHAMGRVLESGSHAHIADPIPRDTAERYHLPDLATALVWVHAPEKESHAAVARKRFSFEEIFVLQSMRAQERALNDELGAFAITDGPAQAKKFLASLAFPPTGAQARAIKDILANFEKKHPMARLLEGDVGAGKTLVAAATAYAVVTSRPPNRASGTLQIAYMAPTEILAGQHFQSFIEYFKDIPINIALITGSGSWKFPSKTQNYAERTRTGAEEWRTRVTSISRAQLLKWVESGEIAMLVGTHALIQKSVKFQHLAYVIVDEQHRFGTRQRQALAQKAKTPPLSGVRAPHFLSMTATPIPRTLALTIYGDLDISVLDELPPGRARITTKIIKPGGRDEAYAAVRRELEAGRQAFVICPRIDEPDPAKFNALQAKSAKAEAARLKKEVFPDFEIGLLHGAMKPAEKDDVMRRFASGEIQILVATSVVEVGINVPNATVMLIEGAERFGLAQLHQLRGRIMRSSHPPHCFLLPETSGEISMKRLRALEGSDDGFKLAESDLEARGAGDLYGRKQWGVSDLGMEALKNPRLIQAAREEAFALVAKDPSLKKYPILKARVEAAGAEHHGE